MLLKHGDFDGAIFYANKAFVTTDSVRAAEVINIATTNRQGQKEVSEETQINSSETPAEEILDESTEETDAEKFKRAKSSNDQALLLSLANKGYAQAYFPVAKNYYNSGNKKQAELWAKKAVAANVDKKQAHDLLDKITTSFTQSDSKNHESTQSTPDVQDKNKRLQDALKNPLKGGIATIVILPRQHK